MKIYGYDELLITLCRVSSHYVWRCVHACLCEGEARSSKQAYNIHIWSLISNKLLLTFYTNMVYDKIYCKL